MAEIRHVTVFRESGCFAGWPANYGIWSWGDEIVVCFTVGFMKLGQGFHSRDRSRPFTTMQARSRDGGETWKAGRMPARAPGDRALSADEHVEGGLQIAPILQDFDMPIGCPESVDFGHPDFGLMCARSGLGAGARSWFYVTYDRCRSWNGPYGLPSFGLRGIAARTDYLREGPSACNLFLTGTTDDGSEGRVFCARTEDAGRTFAFRSWVGPEPEGYSIMPASVALDAGAILVAVRRSGPPGATTERGGWIELYRSTNGGTTWEFAGVPVESTGRGGNPPSMIELADGRLCLTYGFRDPPSGIRARLSEDGGRNWGPELVLRDDGGDHDLGYPRTVQRADGTIVTAYYFNDRAEGERYIAATLWRP